MDISTQRGTPDNPEADTRRPRLVAFCVTARLPASVTARGPAPIGMRDRRFSLVLTTDRAGFRHLGWLRVILLGLVVLLRLLLL